MTYVAGDRDMPEWWTDEDEQILLGETAKLMALPPVRRAAPGSHRVAPPVGRSGAVLVYVGLALLLFVAGMVVLFLPNQGGHAVIPPAGTAPTTIPAPRWVKP